MPEDFPDVDGLQVFERIGRYEGRLRSLEPVAVKSSDANFDSCRSCVSLISERIRR